jgi:hypothetical protein
MRQFRMPVRSSLVTEWQEQVRAVQLDSAREAVALVGSDIVASTSLAPPSWEFRIEDAGSVRVAYFSHFATTPLIGINREDVVVEVADFIQDEVIEDLHSPWPVCPDHETGTYAQIVDGEAVWYCRFGGHAVAAIGQLTS